MARTKQEIETLVNNNLSDFSDIVPEKHRETMNQGILDIKSDETTGSSLNFTNYYGSIYNAATPSGSSTITLDPIDAVPGAVSCFYNDGTVEPTVSPTPNPKAGTWQSGKVNVYWFMWDGTNFTQNIQTQLVILPTLEEPTFTLVAGAPFELDYSNILTPLANSAVMQIATQSNLSDAVTVDSGNYTFGDTSGTITKFGQGGAALTAQLYYVSLVSSATGYNDSPIAIESATASGQATLPAPTITSVTDAGTDNTVLWGAVANADIYDVYVNDEDVFGTASKVVSDTVLLTADIAKIAGLRNYYFVVAKANSGYNDSAPSASDSGYGASLLLQDDFVGTTIDTAKWNEVDSTINGVTISQNNKLIVAMDGSQASGTLDQYIESVSSFNLPFVVVAFDMILTTANMGDTPYTFGLWKDNLNTDIVRATRSAGLDLYTNFSSRISSVNSTNPAATFDFDTKKRIKIKVESGAIDFSYWDELEWVLITTSTQTFTGIAWKCCFSIGNALGVVSSFEIERYYLTSEDYLTELP